MGKRLATTVDRPRALLSLAEAQAALGVSRATIFRLLASGELACVKVGSRTLIEPEELAGFISRGRERRGDDVNNERPPARADAVQDRADGTDEDGSGV
jgi:excisionase family DNA binding protein